MLIDTCWSLSLLSDVWCLNGFPRHQLFLEWQAGAQRFDPFPNGKKSRDLSVGSVSGHQRQIRLSRKSHPSAIYFFASFLGWSLPGIFWWRAAIFFSFGFTVYVFVLVFSVFLWLFRFLPFFSVSWQYAASISEIHMGHGCIQSFWFLLGSKNMLTHNFWRLIESWTHQSFWCVYYSQQNITSNSCYPLVNYGKS